MRLVLQSAVSCAQDDALNLWLQTVASGVWKGTQLPWEHRYNSIFFLVVDNDVGRLQLNSFITTDDGLGAFNATLSTQQLGNVLYWITANQWDGDQLQLLTDFFQSRNETSSDTLEQYWGNGVRYARYYNVPVSDFVLAQVNAFLNPQQASTLRISQQGDTSMHAARRADMASKRMERVQRLQH